MVLHTDTSMRRGSAGGSLPGPRIPLLKKRKAEHERVWEDAPDWNPHRLVFVTEPGERLHPDNFAAWFNRLVKQSGVRRIRLHDLRHTFATLVLAAGADAKLVSESLGHSKINITLDTYRHVLPVERKIVASVFAEVLAGEPGRKRAEIVGTNAPPG